MYKLCSLLTCVPFFWLQSAIKLAGKNNVKKLHTLLSIVEEKPKVDTGQNNRHNEHHIKNHFKHNHYTHNSILTPSTLNQVTFEESVLHWLRRQRETQLADCTLFASQGLDAGTSDDSGRASEQLHGPGIPRDCQDADSSRDHLSDVSENASTKIPGSTTLFFLVLIYVLSVYRLAVIAARVKVIS